MKRIIAILAVIFSLCIAASSVAAQTNEQDQSVYIYSIVKFKNTLQNYMRLNVTGMTAEEINEKLNIFYNPKQSDATYVQNKDGLF